jgi:hypothetical protein
LGDREWDQADLFSGDGRKAGFGMTVSGAYGRDYKSMKAMRGDWVANKDFCLRSLEGSGYVNQEQIGPLVKVWGRYKADTESCLLQSGFALGSSADLRAMKQ